MGKAVNQHCPVVALQRRVGHWVSAAVWMRTRQLFNKCPPKIKCRSMTLIMHHVNEPLSCLNKDIPDN